MYIGLKKSKLLWLAGEITLSRRRIREALLLMQNDVDKDFFAACYHFEKNYFKEFSQFYLFENRLFLDSVRQGDHDAIAEAILFLETDPYCFRSGFIKKKLCRALKQAPLDREERTALRNIVLNAVNIQRPVSFSDFAALGCRLYTPGFHNRVQKLKIIPYKYIAERKRFLLRRLEETAQNFTPPAETQIAPLPVPAPRPAPTLVSQLNRIFKKTAADLFRIISPGKTSAVPHLLKLPGWFRNLLHRPGQLEK